MKKNKIKEPTTYEEFLDAERRNFNSFRPDYIPPVNYNYHVGEEIVCGYLPECFVESIEEDGKVIHFSYLDKGETYGVPFNNHRKLPAIRAWNSIYPKSTETITNFGKERIQTNQMNTTLDSFVHTLYRRGIIDNPDYQREYVWTLEDKQRLIRSLFDRADIGKFMTLSHKYPENRLEIIDGKQRIKAIMDFLEGRFEFEGKTYFQLSWIDKHIFLDQQIQITELQNDKVNRSDILWLFLCINRGGVPQTEEQISKVKELYEEAIKLELKEFF